MKKYLSFITFAIMAVFGLALVSCGGDDDEDDIDAEATIVGTWEVTSIDASYSIGEATRAVGDKMTFRSNGTYVDGDDYGKWKKEGNKLTVTSEDSSEPGVVNIPAVFTITQLTRSVMELKLDYGMLTVVMRLKRV